VPAQRYLTVKTWAGAPEKKSAQVLIYRHPIGHRSPSYSNLATPRTA
jgi:hypothetical protein